MGDITEKRRRSYSGLAADMASIPAGGKAIEDTYFATDTKILYFWDGVAWIIVPLDVIVAGMIKTDAVETVKIKNLNVTAGKLATDSVETLKIKNLNVTPGKAALGFGRYVPIAAGAVDWVEADFTRNNAWHADGLDCTGKVPAGTIAIHFYCNIKVSTAGKKFLLSGNQTTKAYNLGGGYVPVANVFQSLHSIVNCDSDRLVDYYANAEVSDLEVIVLGYFI